MPIYNNLGDMESNSISSMFKRMDSSEEDKKTDIWDCVTAIQKK